MARTPARRSPWNDALTMLARRDLTEGEVRARLDKRGHGGDEVEDVVSRLRARRLLDDARLAREAARGRAERRLDGPAKIRAHLRRRLVPEDLVEIAVGEAFPEGAEAERARAVLARIAPRRREDPSSDEALRRRREREFRRLVSRGYSFEVARVAVFERRGEAAGDAGGLR